MNLLDDSAIRKLRSFGYYEEGNDATRRKVITLRDYPIGVEVLQHIEQALTGHRRLP